METAKKQRGRPFPAGVSGNPQGRPPKGYSISEWFKAMLASKPEIKDAIGNSILKKALQGDPTAQKLVWSYMDGLPPQAIDVTSGGEKLGTAAEVIAAIEASKKK